MKVRAAPGLKVPFEHDPRRHINDQVPVEMPHTHYYLRRMAEGDLVEADVAEDVPPARLTEGRKRG